MSHNGQRTTDNGQRTHGSIDSGYRSPCWSSWAPRSARRDSTTRTIRSRRSRSTSGRSGSATRPRRRSTPRASTRTRCPARSAPAGRTSKRRIGPTSSRSPRSRSCSSSASRAATWTSTCGSKKGTFLSHWPPSTERAGRLQWFKSDLSAEPARGHPAELSPGEPLAPQAARQGQGPLPQARVALRAVHRLRRRADGLRSRSRSAAVPMNTPCRT